MAKKIKKPLKKAKVLGKTLDCIVKEQETSEAPVAMQLNVPTHSIERDIYELSQNVDKLGSSLIKFRSRIASIKQEVRSAAFYIEEVTKHISDE